MEVGVVLAICAAVMWFFWRRRDRRPPAPAATPSEPRFPPATRRSLAEEIETARAAIRSRFEEAAFQQDAEAGHAANTALLEEAVVFLREARADWIIDGFLKEALNWASWQTAGHRAYVPAEIVTSAPISDKDGQGTSREGYSFTYAGRAWSWTVTRTPSHGPHTYAFGRFTVLRDGEGVFECGVSLDYSREFSEWRSDLGSISLFADADWLVDFAAAVELGRNLSRQRARERERDDARTRAAGVTWSPPRPDDSAT